MKQPFSPKKRQLHNYAVDSRKTHDNQSAFAHTFTLKLFVILRHLVKTLVSLQYNCNRAQAAVPFSCSYISKEKKYG